MVKVEQTAGFLRKGDEPISLAGVKSAGILEFREEAGLVPSVKPRKIKPLFPQLERSDITLNREHIAGIRAESQQCLLEKESNLCFKRFNDFMEGVLRISRGV